MQIKTPTLAYYRTSPTKGYRQAQSRVDTKARVIYGAKIIEKMPTIKDYRNQAVDDETLDQVIELGSRPNKGVRARFTHPNLSSDGLGTHLGRWVNFRKSDDGEAVLADLHLADAAFNSPTHGDMGNYLLHLAQEDPEAFMVSVAGVLDSEMAQAMEEEPDVDHPIRFASLHAADIVAEGAATNSLFSIDSQDGIPAAATLLMDKYFAKLSRQDVEKRFTAFLDKYYHSRKSPMDGESNELNEDTNMGDDVITDQVEETKAEETQTPVEETVTEEVSQEEQTEEATVPVALGKKYIEMFGEQGAVWFCEGLSIEAAQQKYTEGLRAQVAELSAKVEQLETQLAAALDAAGDPGVSFSEKSQLTPEQQKAAQRQAELAGRVSPSVAKLAGHFATRN